MSDIKVILLLKEFGICKNKTSLFYPEQGDSYGGRKAKKICQQCPVRDVCLNYAMDHEELYGVWGGTTEYERRRLRRNQGRVASGQ